MMMSEMTICQSCAMPLTTPETFGTNADGSKNEEYCTYCMQDGVFLDDCSMEKQIEDCIPHVSNNNPYPSAEAARAAMQEIFPKLKRWSTRK